MAYDIFAIKETLDLVAVFERDGMTARRVGGNLFVCCPFHAEDSPSCKVTAKRFKCFGCSEGGDVIDYWMRSRGLQQRDAIAELAELAGFAPLPKGVSAPKPPERKKEEETIAPPLSADGTAPLSSGHPSGSPRRWASTLVSMKFSSRYRSRSNAGANCTMARSPGSISMIRAP